MALTPCNRRTVSGDRAKGLSALSEHPTCTPAPSVPQRRGEAVLFRHDDPQIGAITERIRAMVSRQPGHDLCSAALALKLPALDLARLLDARDPPDRTFLVDVVAALAHEAGVDPQWILTGAYDAGVHRHVLRLGEDRSAFGRSNVRDFVQEQYRKLRRDAPFAWLPGRRSARPVKAPPSETARSA